MIQFFRTQNDTIIAVDSKDIVSQEDIEKLTYLPMRNIFDRM